MKNSKQSCCRSQAWSGWQNRFYGHPALSVRALSKVFRGKFMASLRKMFTNGELIFPGKIAYVGTAKGSSDLVSQLWQKAWVVYSKAPFNGPEKVLDHLGRYTHRVAIANHRIVKAENGSVTFRTCPGRFQHAAEFRYHRLKYHIRDALDESKITLQALREFFKAKEPVVFYQT
ncbi:MAG: transposase [Phycisphaerales bacterium]|nr:MAG: transposase [Phycisphaerales bacterium]